MHLIEFPVFTHLLKCCRRSEDALIFPHRIVDVYILEWVSGLDYKTISSFLLKPPASPLSTSDEFSSGFQECLNCWNCISDIVLLNLKGCSQRRPPWNELIMPVLGKPTGVKLFGQYEKMLEHTYIRYSGKWWPCWDWILNLASSSAPLSNLHVTHPGRGNVLAWNRISSPNFKFNFTSPVIHLSCQPQGTFSLFSSYCEASEIYVAHLRPDYFQ